MSDRALDFYMKDLPIGIKQELFDHMYRGISETMMKWFREKPEGYPSLHKCGFSDDDLQLIFDAYVPKFEKANRIMAEYGRAPLFSNPHDAYQSGVEYEETMKLRTDEEILEYIGCSFADYEPALLD